MLRGGGPWGLSVPLDVLQTPLGGEFVCTPGPRNLGTRWYRGHRRHRDFCPFRSEGACWGPIPDIGTPTPRLSDVWSEGDVKRSVPGNRTLGSNRLGRGGLERLSIVGTGRDPVSRVVIVRPVVTRTRCRGWGRREYEPSFVFLTPDCVRRSCHVDGMSSHRSDKRYVQSRGR